MRKERKQLQYNHESLDLRFKRTEIELKETQRKYEQTLSQVCVQRRARARACASYAPVRPHLAAGGARHEEHEPRRQV